jgi:hypothetical protein
MTRLDTKALIWVNRLDTKVLIWMNRLDTKVLIWMNRLDTKVLIWDISVPMNLFKPVKNDLLSPHLQPFLSVIFHILFNHDLLNVVWKSLSIYSGEIQTWWRKPVKASFVTKLWTKSILNCRYYLEFRVLCIIVLCLMTCSKLINWSGRNDKVYCRMWPTRYRQMYQHGSCYLSGRHGASSCSATSKPNIHSRTADKVPTPVWGFRGVNNPLQ